MYENIYFYQYWYGTSCFIPYDSVWSRGRRTHGDYVLFGCMGRTGAVFTLNTMRSIKFRAWDKNFKKMFYEGFGVSAKGTYYIESTSKDIEIMEYTGLKDKNGKEIYEGDIVNSYYDKPFIIEHTIGNHIKTTGHGETAQEYISGFVFQYDSVEVIGNIYENPELLKKT